MKVLGWGPIRTLWFRVRYFVDIDLDAPFNQGEPFFYGSLAGTVSITALARAIAGWQWIVERPPPPVANNRILASLVRIDVTTTVLLSIALAVGIIAWVGIGLRAGGHSARRAARLATAGTLLQITFSFAALGNFLSKYEKPAQPWQWSTGFYAACEAVVCTSISFLLFCVDLFRLGAPMNTISVVRRKLLFAALAAMSYLVIMALVFERLEPTWNFEVAFVWTVFTALTIGYGQFDVSTDPSKILLFFFGPVAIGLIGFLLFTIRDNLLESAREQIKRSAVGRRLSVAIAESNLRWDAVGGHGEEELDLPDNRSESVRRFDRTPAGSEIEGRPSLRPPSRSPHAPEESGPGRPFPESARSSFESDTALGGSRIPLTAPRRRESLEPGRDTSSILSRETEGSVGALEARSPNPRFERTGSLRFIPAATPALSQEFLGAPVLGFDEDPDPPPDGAVDVEPIETDEDRESDAEIPSDRGRALSRDEGEAHGPSLSWGETPPPNRNFGRSRSERPRFARTRTLDDSATAGSSWTWRPSKLLRMRTMDAWSEPPAEETGSPQPVTTQPISILASGGGGGGGGGQGQGAPAATLTFARGASTVPRLAPPPLQHRSTSPAPTRKKVDVPRPQSSFNLPDSGPGAGIPLRHFITAPPQSMSGFKSPEPFTHGVGLDVGMRRESTASSSMMTPVTLRVALPPDQLGTGIAMNGTLSRTLTIDPARLFTPAEARALRRRIEILTVLRISVVFVGYWFLGALVFSVLEGWRYLDALYFCWSTLTTVGYGDIVPVTPGAWEFWFYFCFLEVALFAYMIALIGDIINKRMGSRLERTLSRDVGIMGLGGSQAMAGAMGMMPRLSEESGTEETID